MKQVLRLLTLLCLFVLPFSSRGFNVSFTTAGTGDTSCLAPHSVGFLDVNTYPCGASASHKFYIYYSGMNGTLGTTNPPMDSLGPYVGYVAFTPLYTFSTAGYYTIKEVVICGTDTESVTRTNLIYTVPTPTLSFTTAIPSDHTAPVCGPRTISFVNTTADTSTCSNSWHWQVIGPTGPSEVTYDYYTSGITQTFTTPGNYNVILSLTNGCGCHPAQYERDSFIVVQAPPVACFTPFSNAHTCNPPDNICFTNCSSGATSYEWHWGDNTTSTSFSTANMCHSFTTPGIYSDTLIAISSAGCTATVWNLNEDTVNATNGYIAPSSLIDTVCQFTSNVFVDSSVATPVSGFSTTWSVFDNTNTLVSGPIPGSSFPYSFDQPGRFKVVDTSVNMVTGCIAVASHYVFVRTSPNIDTFSIDSVYRCSAPLHVHFASTPLSPATAGPYTYVWHFNPTSSVTHIVAGAGGDTASHIYTASGSPSVKVTDIHGCSDSVSVSGGVFIGAPTPHLNVSVDSGCVTPTTGIRVGWTTSITPSNVPYILTDTVFTSDGGVFLGNSFSDSAHVFHTVGTVTIKRHWHLPASLGGCSGYDSVSILLNDTIPNGSIHKRTYSVCPGAVDSFWANCTNCSSQTWIINTIGLPPSGGNIGGSYISYTDTTTAPFAIPGKKVITWIGDVHGCVDTLVDTVRVFGPYTPNATSTRIVPTVPACTLADSMHLNINWGLIPNSDVVSYVWHYNPSPDTSHGNPTSHNFSDDHPLDGYHVFTVVLQGDVANDSNCTNFFVDSAQQNFPNAAVLTIDSPVCRGAVLHASGPLTPSGLPYPSYKWYWHSGTTSQTTIFNPNNTHVYTANGFDTVMLVIVGPYSSTCLDTLPTKIARIVGPTGPLNAVTPLTGCSTLSVTLHDSAYDMSPFFISSRYWYLNATPSFGTPTAADTVNGSGSANITHTFPEGTYNVVVRDTDNLGCTSAQSVIVHSVHPHAYFYSPDTAFHPCIGLAVPFHDTNSNCTYTWDFGDGSGTVTTTSQDVTHVYTANGNWDVTVTINPTASNTLYPVGCTSSYTHSSYIHVAPVPVALTFPLGTVTACPPFQFLALNDALHTDYNYTWEIYHAPDSTITGTPTGALYNNTGTHTGNGSSTTIPGQITFDWHPSNIYALLDHSGAYYVRLIATTPYGCTDSVTDSIHIQGPNGYVTTDVHVGCSPLTVETTFNPYPGTTVPAGQFIWDYHQAGAQVGSITHDVFIYDSAGTYDPASLTIISNGCVFPFQGIDTVHVYQTPNVSVTHPAPACYGSTVYLYAHGADTYSWSPATYLNNPVDSFVQSTPAPGVSSITYTVTGTTIHNCVDTVVTTVNILPPVAVHIVGRDSVCIGELDTLTATGLPDYHYVWDSTAGINCAVCNPVVITTTTTETYTVIATNAAGCTGRDSFKVTINPLPVVTYLPDPAFVCQGGTQTLHGVGASTYAWKPLLGLSCGNCQSPVCSITSNIIYTLTGTTQFGCHDSVDVPVNYYIPVPVTINADTTICFGDQAHLLAYGGETYLWTSNPAGSPIDNNTVHNPIVTPDTTTTYHVHIVENPCFTADLSTKVTVIPTPVLAPMTETTIIAGNSVHLNADVTNGDAIVHYIWTPSDSTLSCIDCPSPIATPTATTTYTVNVSTIEGCHSDGSVTIHIICNNSQVFIPNTFTPNGDGVNDHFFVSGKGLGLIKRMAIYNRWGELMFEARDINANDPGMGWDGTFRGSIIEPDVFIYVIDVNCETGEPFSFKGDISLVR